MNQLSIRLGREGCAIPEQIRAGPKRRPGLVAGDAVVVKGRAHRLITALTVGLLAAGWAVRADGQELLRFTRNVAGESKPLDLAADEVATWIEDGRLVVMLRGNVLVHMGVFHARFAQGVLWVDLQRQKSTKVLHTDLYAEGNLRIEIGADEKRGTRGLLDLNTRGSLELKSVKSRVAQQVRRDDDLYRRAL